MRDHLRTILSTTRRSGDRIVVDGAPNHGAPLGPDLVRLARLATSIHLGCATRQRADAAPVQDRATAMRERTS